MNGKIPKGTGHLFCALTIVASIFLWACTTPTAKQDEISPGTAVLETIQITPEGNRSVIAITSSSETTCSPFFTLSSPPRICVDIKGIPSNTLSHTVSEKNGPVRRITLQDRGSGYTGIVIYLREGGNACTVTSKGTVTRIEIGPAGATKQANTPGVAPAPKGSLLPQILNVEVSQPKKYRTRLTISCEKELQYQQKLSGKTLSLDFKDSAISPALTKEIHAKSFEGAVKSVNVVPSKENKDATLLVTLRALCPYHISRNGSDLNVDFAYMPKKAAPDPDPAARISPPPPKKKSRGENTMTSKAVIYEATSQQYAGQRMSFNFVDTDIRNILRLISEVAGLNIVWGSDVEGKISMTLDDVPWDQAIEMILRPNGLTYQIENDVLWVVPRSKLVDMEIAEKKRKNALMAAKRLQGIFEAKIIEFILIRNRKAGDIYRMLMGDRSADPPIMPILDIEGGESEEKEEGEEEQGKKTKIAALDLYLSYDDKTNMIIANGVRAKVDKVKEFIAKLDVAAKQVMIEARVVEATTGFARDLGIRWSSLDGSNPGFEADWMNLGSNSRGNTQFSTNAPGSWSPNIGMAIGWLTGGGLGSVALDASLALAQEDEQINILSAPRVMTLNGEEAFVSRGTVDYYAIRTLDTISYEQIPALLSLTVTPTVSADNSHVTMKVEVTDDKPLNATQSTTEEGTEESPPGRTEKKITSTLIVRTGETVVIGGIYQKNELTADTGIPWLKDIPLVGWLFKAEHKTREQVELLIFLTPTVIDSEGKEV